MKMAWAVRNVGYTTSCRGDAVAVAVSTRTPGTTRPRPGVTPDASRARTGFTCWRWSGMGMAVEACLPDGTALDLPPFLG
jgi:hypothetical protein